jgi:hypothetical protein
MINITAFHIPQAIRFIRLFLAFSFCAMSTAQALTVLAFSSATLSGLAPETQKDGTVYFVDAERGSDKNSGQSENAAWQSLEKVNGHIFRPGDQILLKSGSAWIGQLKPKGAGTATAPIRIDQYGKGLKPLIVGNGIVDQGVVLLHNQSYWEINNLEITNDAATNAERRGVEIGASNYGIVEHVYLKNLIVHDIKGNVGNKDSDKKSSGIYFGVIDDKIKATRFNDILVEGCLIYNCQNEGIVTVNEVGVSGYPGSADWERRKFTNLIIRNNIIHHISKNAMIVRLADGGLVERNLCYETATGTQGNTIFSRSSKGTVFQYNEGFLNRSATADGSLYDPDINSPGTIWQYSFSHDNAHGLVWFCTDEKDDDIVVRYNVSQNDRGNLVYFNYPFKSARVYNNVFYIGEGLSPTLIREKGSSSHSYLYANNIVYNNSKMADYAFASGAGKGVQTRSITNNIFYNTPSASQIPANLNASKDPLFVNPGLAEGPESVNGYMLKPGSPALAAGLLIDDHGGRDYFGRAVAKTEKPNIGFYNGTGVVANAVVNPADNLKFLKTNSVGTVNGIVVTKEEVQREMTRYRAEVIGLIADKALGQLRNKALKALTLIKIQEQMLQKHRLAPYKSYSEFLDHLQRTNALRKEKVANGQIIYGPVEFSEQAFFDYRFSNAIIRLKQQLVAEQLIPITKDRLQAQFSKMQQTVYAEKKFTFNDCYPQVREAYIEACYAELIDSYTKKSVVKIN